MKVYQRFVRWLLTAALAGTLAVVLTLMSERTVPAMSAADNDIYSSNMILVDMTENQVVAESGSRDRIYPASLTKIMTVLISIERLSELGGIDMEMTVPEDIFDKLYAENASMAGFAPGETVPARDLLYGMMLPSGADAAVGMAENLYGSEEVFVYKMNEKAQMLGMDNTHFVNVTGLHDDNHYSTLEDLSLLLKYALKNETFRKIFTTSVYETAKTAEHPNGILMESTLFGKMSVEALEDLTILGGKTGFTNKAGLCLATLASMDEKEYILITAGAKSRTSASPFHILDAIKIYSTFVSVQF